MKPKVRFGFALVMSMMCFAASAQRPSTQTAPAQSSRAQTLPALVGPEVTAKSATLIDAASGKTLWKKDPDASRFPASTTKIMTAMLLLEHCTPDEIITAPWDVTKVKEASMHLKPYEQVSARDMLYALMLRSANDGCYAVAMHISHSVPAFARLMNARAAQLGCTNTHFENPNGLHNPMHSTSAHDLALMARAAMRYPLFREVVRTQRYEIQRSINQKDRIMVNHDRYLKKDSSADGVKTGWTRPAGHCFVGSATRDGMRFITAILASNRWQEDNESLFDWAYQHFQRHDQVQAGDVVGTIQVENGTSPELQVQAQRGAYTVSRIGQDDRAERFLAVQSVKAPVTQGQSVGDLVIRDSDGFEQRVPVVAENAVPLTPSLALVRAGSSPKGSTVFFGSVLFLGAYLVRGRSRRVKKYETGTKGPIAPTPATARQVTEAASEDRG